MVFKSGSLVALIISVSLWNSSKAFTVNNCFVHNGHSSTSSSRISTRVFMAQRRRLGREIEKKPPMNAEIKYEELRVTLPNIGRGETGKEEILGILTKSEALAKAAEMGNLDLILVNENSVPPVAKIADYSKYRYELQRKKKETKKNSKSTEVKEVKMSYKIDVGDFGVRVKNASKFIKQGNRVKCTVVFKGREIQHSKLGVDLLYRITEELTDICTMEGKPKKEGRGLNCMLTPRPDVIKAVNAKRREGEKQKKKKKEQKFEADAEMKENTLDDSSSAEEEVAAVVIELAPEDDDDDTSLEDLLGADELTDNLFG